MKLIALLFVTIWGTGESVSKLSRSRWGLKVYVQPQTISLRRISATDATFTYEGIIKYGWRDDSVWFVAEDGDSYPGPDNILWGYGTTNQTQYAYSTGQLTGTPSWFGPVVVPRFPTRQTSNVDSLTYTVNYGALNWTGVAASNDPLETWIEGQQSISGVFLQSQALQDFPFDTQVASFTLVTSQETSDMTFVIAPGSLATLMPPSNPDGWTVQGTNIVLDVDTSRGSSNSRLRFQTRVERIGDFFVNRFVTPLCLVMIIAYGSLFLTAGFAGRLAAPMVAFGSTVSFLFVAAQSVPQLPYATRLDKFFQLMFFSCFILFTYHIVMYLVYEKFSKAVVEARKRAGGRLHVCCGPPPAAPVPLSSNSPVGVSNPLHTPEAAVITVAGSRASADTPAKPAATLVGVLLETAPHDFADTIFFCIFCCSFLVAASIILRGPSGPPV